MKKVLILCTGNSCRSQIAHGYLKQYKNLEVVSAGIETHGLNLRAVKIMAEDGIDISDHKSTLIDDYLDSTFDYVITVCDHANETCPVFPTTSEKIHHSFSDPAKATGTEEEIMNAFRDVRDQIKFFCEGFHSKASRSNF
jgi:arsenate reductase